MPIHEDIISMNPHWEQGFEYRYKFERNIFVELKKELNKRLITIINGPRRVGKTVLMRQLIQNLIDNGIDRKQILYFSFDEGIYDLKDVVKEYEYLRGKGLRTGKPFLFLDEIQYLRDWGQQLKFFYDLFEGIKIVCSGSASLLVRKGTESLAGRTKEFHISNLDFNEYLKFSGKPHIDSSVAAKIYYRDYMNNQLPEIAMKKVEPVEYVRSIIKKGIYEDIPKLYGAKSGIDAEELFKTVCRSPGEIIEYSDISKDFGIERETVKKYFDALTNSLLLRKLYNYSRNPRKIETRNKKFYPYMSTYHLFTFPMVPDESKVAETEVANLLNAEYFWNEKGKEIDFIAGIGLDIGVEVKFRKRIDDSDFYSFLSNPLKLKRKIGVVPFNTDLKITHKDLEILDLYKLRLNII